MRIKRPLFWFLGAIISLVHTAHAHEFWVSMDEYQVETGTPMTAQLRVGENLKGVGYPYIPDRATRFDLVIGDTVTPVEARLGDRPALNMVAPKDGLVIVVHETSDLNLIYRELDKFRNFTTHKDYPDAVDRHLARGLPDTGFKETYRRYAKALVAVGDGAGADREVGLRTEIVALANPYTDDLSAGLPVLVLLDGDPRPNTQVEIFAKSPDSAVQVSQIRTDDTGRAVVKVAPGVEYLLDAVVLEDTGNDDPEQGAVWHSLWAALTFRVPQ